MFHILPLLKGWDWKYHPYGPAVLQRGATPLEYSIDERGLMLHIQMTGDDLYDRVDVEWKGSQLQPHSIFQRFVDFATFGAFAQDPTGWCQRFLQPNPYNSAGFYNALLFSGWGQGSTLPYLENTKVRLSLGGESNQLTSTLFVELVGIAILDVEVFIQSLRSVMAIKDLKIDPNLLTYAQTLKE